MEFNLLKSQGLVAAGESWNPNCIDELGGEPATGELKSGGVIGVILEMGGDPPFVLFAANLLV